MVAMNPQTWDKDLAEIEPGGYLFYDSTRPLPKSKFRDDIHVIGMPLTEICNREYTDPRERQLFKNIIYVGALSALLDLDLKEVEKLIGEQYKGKEKLLEPNIKALHMGRDYAASFLPSIDLKVKRADKVGNRIFLEGNSAAALGACTAARRSRPGTRSRPPRRSPRPSRATAASTASTPTPARTATPSCRPRTSWPRSAW